MKPKKLIETFHFFTGMTRAQIHKNTPVIPTGITGVSSFIVLHNSILIF